MLPNYDLINIKLVIAYDGTEYLGWQKTFSGPSIEASLRQIIEQILQEPIKLQAASRTDAGVHARGQTVNFFTKHINLDVHRFQFSLNSLLPKDIVVIKTEIAPQNFHPTINCSGKEYRYFICNSPIQYPEYRNFSWHVHQELHVSLMEQAAQILTGEHDFSAFCNAKKNEAYVHHIRSLEKIEIQLLEEKRFCIKMLGNHFLYKMARNIAGTLVDIGRGKILLDDLKDILEKQDRRKAGITAPAHGLTLFRILY